MLQAVKDKHIAQQGVQQAAALASPGGPHQVEGISQAAFGPIIGANTAYCHPPCMHSKEGCTARRFNTALKEHKAVSLIPASRAFMVLNLSAGRSIYTLIPLYSLRMLAHKTTFKLYCSLAILTVNNVLVASRQYRRCCLTLWLMGRPQ